MEKFVVVRGGGDIATGTISMLYKCGFRVLILECAQPTAIRRKVAFCEAVYQGEQTVEDVTCRLTGSAAEALRVMEQGGLPMLIDPEAKSVGELKPDVLVDAILAKRNTGTTIDMAPLTIGLGPGFEAGVDVDVAIETMRGHTLGRILTEGSPIPDTGTPGLIGGYGRERVIHSPASGVIRCRRNIADQVRKGEVIAVVESDDQEVPVEASLDGLLRGIIRDGFPVTKGLKIADVDPRLSEHDNCFTISDKARCIAGGVLEAILSWEKGLTK